MAILQISQRGPRDGPRFAFERDIPMAPPLRNLLLSAVLIAVPAGGFTVAEIMLPPAAPAASQAPAGNALGDLSAYQAIVRDTQAIAAKGDLAAAERRITDLETLWDENAARLRKADAAAWGAVDDAADAAFAALRARTPDQARVEATLTTLQNTLEAPVADAGSQPVQRVAGTAVTDTSGRPLPCEEMIGQLRDRLAGTTPSPEVADLQSKALERCNADDDARADAFAAQALALTKG